MQLFDQHIHSRHSFDSQTPPEDNVQAALERGLGGLTFTEHFDTHPAERDACRYDDAAYSDAIAGLRARFSQRIFIGKGIEVCYQPDNMGFILDFLANHRFDLVILSVHWARGRQLGWRKHWQGLDPAAGTRRYLQTVLEAARACRDLRQRHSRRCFDVLGHLDFVKRYTFRYFDQLHVDREAGLIDDILQACLEADLIPEVNTSTLRQGLTEPMPGPNTIRRYAALGGTAMSIGSDAHLAKSVGTGFDQAAKTLHRAGIIQQVLFQDRQSKLVPLHA